MPASNTTPQRNNSWVFLGAATLFFALSLLQARNLYQQSVAAQREASHSGNVLRALQAVRGSLQGWDGYDRFTDAAVRDSVIDAERRATQAASLRHLHTFDSLAQDHPLQQQRVAALRRLVNERYRGQAAPGSRTRILAILDQLESTQEALFLRHTEAFERSSRHRYLYSISGFLLFGLFGLITLMRADRLARRRAKAEEDARVAEARYRMLLENSELALLVLDPSGDVRFVGNAPYIERIMGYRPEQLLGRRSVIPVPHEVPGNDRRSNEFRITRADGTSRWLAYRVNTIYDEAGAVAEHQIVTWDIDAEKRMALELEAAQDARDRERHLLQKIIDQLPNIVYVKDLEGRYVLVNSNTRSLFEVSESERLLGHKLGEIGYASTEAHFTSMDETVRREQRVLTREEQHWVKGKLRWFYLVKFPIFDADGTLKYTGGVSTDITEMKNKEQALISAKHDAETARAGQEAFLASISHELRTPLNGIMGMANLLAGTPLNEEQHDFTDTILASARTLLVLINDLLDFSKIKAGKFTFERQPFRVRHAVRKALYPLQLRAEEKGISLNLHFDNALPHTLIGDALRLNQVLSNLVSNAVKFTARGGVSISLAGSGDPGETVQLQATVEDTGIGIPEDKLSYIFESFAQNTSGTSRQYGGTGLGLAIVKQLVTLQGGTIEVESIPGQGSTFTAIIPFEIGQEKAERTEGGEATTGVVENLTLQGLRILVAEDNLINQKVARSTLERAGALVTVVENGREAVDALTESRGAFDVVVLDLQMPEMDGFAAARAIRKQWGTAIPLIAMTADALKGEAERCVDAGMVGFVSKPFEPAELYRQINQAVRTTGRNPSTASTVATPAPPPPADVPEIDLSYVAELSGGDPSYIPQLLRIFLDSAPPTMTLLHELLQDGSDLPAIQRTAHQLKSSFGVVRLPGVLETLQAVETAAANGAFSKATELERFETAYATLQAALPKLEAMRDGNA